MMIIIWTQWFNKIIEKIIVIVDNASMYTLLIIEGCDKNLRVIRQYMNTIKDCIDAEYILIKKNKQ